MSLYEGAVKKPIMTSLCFLAVAIFGLFSLSKLPVDLYPDIETNTIMVMTSYAGASASDIENNVTRPLENTLNSVSNLKHITSRSSEDVYKRQALLWRYELCKYHHQRRSDLSCIVKTFKEKIPC